MSWIDSLDIDDLTAEAPSLTFSDYEKEFTLEMAASYLWKGGPFPPQAALRSRDREVIGYLTDDRPPKRLWEYIEKEIYYLVCTDDKKYDRLREKLNAAADKGKLPLTGIIAAWLGDQLGVQATVISGFCAIALFAVTKVGKEACCSRAKENYT